MKISMAGGQKGGAATGNLITVSGHFATLTSRRSRCFAFGTSPGILRTCTYNACSLRVVTQQHYSTASFSDWTDEKGPLQACIILQTIQPRQPQQTRLSVKGGRFVFQQVDSCAIEPQVRGRCRLFRLLQCTISLQVYSATHTFRVDLLDPVSYEHQHARSRRRGSR